MTDKSPTEKAVDADLNSDAFRVGVNRGWWRKLSYEFPILVMAVSAVEPNGDSSEYCFRFELTGFPGTAPEVKIWDVDTQAVLAVEKLPKGSHRVNEAFKNWNGGTVYRPWERSGLQHNNWANTHPDLAWRPNRTLAFILEDLHGLLTSNAAACGSR